MQINTLEALKKLYEELNIENPDIFKDMDDYTLTESLCRSGRIALWYLDGLIDVAIYTDTLEFLSEKELEEELC